MSQSLHDKDRPFDGQPHTDAGERGKTMVEGLRMRDIADAIGRGILLSTGRSPHYEKARDGRATYADLYEIPRSEMGRLDPGAIIQNAMCEIERAMGIFPNIPPVRSEP